MRLGRVPASHDIGVDEPRREARHLCVKENRVLTPHSCWVASTVRLVSDRNYGHQPLINGQQPLVSVHNKRMVSLSGGVYRHLTVSPPDNLGVDEAGRYARHLMYPTGCESPCKVMMA